MLGIGIAGRATGGNGDAHLVESCVKLLLDYNKELQIYRRRYSGWMPMRVGGEFTKCVPAVCFVVVIKEGFVRKWRRGASE